MVEQGEQDLIGERGPTGDHGQDGATGPRGPRGDMQTWWNKAAVLVAVLITVVFALYSGYAAHLAGERLDRTVREGNCRQAILAQTITALSRRSEVVIEHDRRTVELEKAQQALLRTPPGDPTVSQAAVQMYLKALNAVLVQEDKAQNVVTNNPFPTDAQVEACTR